MQFSTAWRRAKPYKTYKRVLPYYIAVCKNMSQIVSFDAAMFAFLVKNKSKKVENAIFHENDAQEMLKKYVSKKDLIEACLKNKTPRKWTDQK